MHVKSKRMGIITLVYGRFWRSVVVPKFVVDQGLSWP